MATTLGTVDAGGDGKQVLLAALNYKLGTTFTLDDFEFSAPEAVAIPSPTHNTMIRFGPLAHSGYYGIKKIYYNRIHVTELGIIRVVKGTATRVSHLLGKINEKYGILVTELDIYDAVLPDLPVGQTETEVNFDFRPTSVAFYGGTRIALGFNDPGIIDPSAVTLPFEPTWMFFGENITQGKLDAFSVTIDQDMKRKRYGSTIVGAAVTGLDSLYQRQIAPSEANNGYFGQVVGAWKSVTDNNGFILSVYAQVFRRNGSATEWEYISSVESVNLLDVTEVNEWQEQKPVKLFTQNRLGHVFTLIGKTALKLYKSVDNGTTWESKDLTGDTYFISSINWTVGEIKVLDTLAIADDVFALVSFKEADVIRTRLLKVEMETGAVTAVSVDDMKLLNTDTYLGPGAVRVPKACFVSGSELSVTNPTFVVCMPVKDSSDYQVYWVEYSASSYQAKATTSLTLYPEQGKYKGHFVSAYTTALSKDSTTFLDVIEVGTMINTDEPDFEIYAAGERLRNTTGFYTHAVVAMTSVRKGNQRNEWKVNTFKLGKGEYPQRMIFSDAGKRMHYVMQPEYGMTVLSFNEDNALMGFLPVIDPNKIIAMELHTGFTYHSFTGVAKYKAPEINETSNTNYGMTTYSNVESTSDLISFSFIAKDALGDVKWLTSKDSLTALSERTFKPEYAFMGQAPVAVFNNDTVLYAVSGNNKGVWKFNIPTKGWEYFGDLMSFYKPADETQLFGWSYLPVKPEYFQKMCAVDTTVEFKVSVNDVIKVTKPNGLELSEDHTLTDQAIVKIKPNSEYTEAIHYERVDEVSSFGFNATSIDSPRRFSSLTFTTDGSVKYSAEVSDAADYDTAKTNLTLPAAITAGMKVLDVRSDVLYLNLKQIILVDDAGVKKLFFEDETGTVTEQQLLGGDTQELKTFDPEVVFSLYDYNETNYVPLVYYGNKKVYLIGRMISANAFTKTLHSLSIPSDNGTPVIAVPVFSSNRCEYLFYQKGNGIFKINYSNDAVTNVATVSMVRIFTLNAAMATYEIVSACVADKAAVVAPTVPQIYTPPANGTLLATSCQGTTKMGTYADGAGGTYIDMIEANSMDCGYVAPPAGTLSADAVTLKASLTYKDAGNVTHSAVVDTEGGTGAYVVFNLSSPLTNNSTFNTTLNYVTASAADIATSKVKIGTGAETDITFPGTIMVPAGETEFRVIFTYSADAAVEGDEKFVLTVAKQESDTHITNSQPIEVEFTIKNVP